MPGSMTFQSQNPGFPFNSMTEAAAVASVPKPVDNQYSDGSPASGGDGAGFSIESVRKKRGRPRKYSPDNSIGLGLSPVRGNQVSSTARQEDSSSGGGSGVQPSGFGEETTERFTLSAWSWFHSTCSYGECRRGIYYAEKLKIKTSIGKDVASKIMDALFAF